MFNKELRKLWMLLFVIVVVLAMVACTGGGAAKGPVVVNVDANGMVDTSAMKQDPPYVFCFSNASVSNSWRVSMVEHLRFAVDELKEQGIVEEYYETDANDDETKQIADIEDLLTKGCDILIISASTAEAVTPAAEKAMDQGVPVVTVDRNIASDRYVSFVEQDSCDMGRRQAEWLVEAMGGKGNVVLLSGIAGATPAEDRLRCAREVFAQYPEITELAQAYASWSPTEGKTIMENWLTTFDQIDGVWSDSGLQGSGAVEAFVEAGREVPPITGEDFNRYLKQWKEMGFEGYAVSFSVRMGYEAVQVALKVLQGEPVAHYISVEPLIIDNSNLDQFVRMDLPDDYWAASMPEVADRLFPK